MKKISLALTSLCLTTPAITLALTQDCSSTDCSVKTISDYITIIINWVLGFAALIAVLFLIYGGILYVTASGNTDRAKSARQTIMYAVIGLIVIVLSYFIVSLVINGANSFVSGGQL